MIVLNKFFNALKTATSESVLTVFCPGETKFFIDASDSLCTIALFFGSHDSFFETTLR